MYNDYYRDKVCVITGGSSGIGLELGRQLLEEGAVVCLASRTAADLDRAAGALAEHHPGRVFSRPLDVTDADAVRSLMDDTAARHGRIDFLFNNAGVGSMEATPSLRPEDWTGMLNINLMGVIHGVQAVMPHMLRQGHGHIVNTSSIAGIVPIPYQTVYCTAKFGVSALSECLRWELIRFGIYVSCLCPGNVVTPIFSKIGRPTPDDAIPVDYAARWALERIEKKQGIIPVAETAQWLYDLYRQKPEEFERLIRTMEAERFALLSSE